MPICRTSARASGHSRAALPVRLAACLPDVIPPPASGQMAVVVAWDVRYAGSPGRLQHRWRPDALIFSSRATSDSWRSRLRRWASCAALAPAYPGSQLDHASKMGVVLQRHGAGLHHESTATVQIGDGKPNRRRGTSKPPGPCSTPRTAMPAGRLRASFSGSVPAAAPGCAIRTLSSALSTSVITQKTTAACVPKIFDGVRPQACSDFHTACEIQIDCHGFPKHQIIVDQCRMRPLGLSERFAGSLIPSP